MPTRRDFLKGTGAALSGLLVPALAHAWGRRRRRCQPACPPAGGAPACLDTPSQAWPYAPCSCVCPTGYYGASNGIYYYYGFCCNGCPNGTAGIYVDASDTVYHDLCMAGDCTCTNCFPVGPGGGLAPAAHESRARGRPFHPSTTSQQTGINQPIDPTANFRPGPHAQQLAARTVWYNDPTTRGRRYARLFVVQGDFAVGPLQVGQETRPVAGAEEYEFGTANGHHHVIHPKGQPAVPYHVLTVK